jgi:hypothetical protein
MKLLDASAAGDNFAGPNFHETFNSVRMLSQEEEMKLQKEHSVNELNRFLSMRSSELLKEQPSLHAEQKSMCMKIFQGLS